MEIDLVTRSFKNRRPQCVRIEIEECQAKMPIRIVELFAKAISLDVLPIDSLSREPKTPDHQTTEIGLEAFTRYPTRNGLRAGVVGFPSRS